MDGDRENKTFVPIVYPYRGLIITDPYPFIGEIDVVGAFCCFVLDHGEFRSSVF